MNMEHSEQSCTIGRYLGKRLRDIGVSRFFTVPGDYTMSLLDQLLAEDLKVVGCCNELNAGYAADGYARLSGNLSVLVVTYMVGALSALNAVAGAAAHDLPLLVIVGSPNSNAVAQRRNVHHTIGDGAMDRCMRCFEPIVASSFKILNGHESQNTIDAAIMSCLSAKKPVYLEIACNVAMEKVSPPMPVGDLRQIIHRHSDETSLGAAVEEIANQINGVSRVLIVIGSKVRSNRELCGVRKLVEQLNCGVVVMPDAKGLYPETSEEYLGCYWGDISSPGVQQLVEQNAEVLLFLGPVFSDYTTVGWTAKYPVEKKIVVNTNNVHVHKDDRRYSFVNSADIIERLCEAVHAKPNEVLQQYKECCKHACTEVHRCRSSETVHEPPRHHGQGQGQGQGQGLLPRSQGGGKSTTGGQHLQSSGMHRVGSKEGEGKQDKMKDPLSIEMVQKLLPDGLRSMSANVLVAETGDAWFIAENMKLPVSELSFQIQMQYGSIGWALAALVGMGVHCQDEHFGKVVALIGDGSFQVSAQELSTLVRQNINVTIILLNNCSYAIENQIHPGPYNDLQCWDYVGFLESVVGKQAKKSHHAMGMHVHTNEEFAHALHLSSQHHGVFLMDCHISKDDCTPQLHNWGCKVASASMEM